MSRFYVGQKVVCVDADPGGHHAILPDAYYLLDMSGLSELTVYTVRRLVKDVHCIDGIGMMLCEIRRGGDEPFSASRFRPAVEPSTDISIFTAMLNPAKQTEPVE